MQSTAKQLHNPCETHVSQQAVHMNTESSQLFSDTWHTDTGSCVQQTLEDTGGHLYLHISAAIHFIGLGNPGVYSQCAELMTAAVLIMSQQLCRTTRGC